MHRFQPAPEVHICELLRASSFRASCGQVEHSRHTTIRIFALTKPQRLTIYELVLICPGTADAYPSVCGRFHPATFDSSSMVDRHS